MTAQRTWARLPAMVSFVEERSAGNFGWHGSTNSDGYRTRLTGHRWVRSYLRLTAGFSSYSLTCHSKRMAGTGTAGQRPVAKRSAQSGSAGAADLGPGVRPLFA